jgi:hypothetical protein
MTTTKTTTTKTGASEPIPPWKSQKIWAMVIGIVLVAVLFAFGREVEAVALAGLVGTFVLGRGLERLGTGLVLCAALTLGACGAGAQVDSSACIQAAIRAATDVIAECLPRSQAGEACPVEPGAAP